MLFKYRRATLADVLDEHVKDPLAKAVCGASWPYLGTAAGAHLVHGLQRRLDGAS